MARADAYALGADARLIIALQTLPVLLFGPYGGVVADRVDKRRLMVILQIAMGLQALVLGLLTVAASYTCGRSACSPRSLDSTTPSRARAPGLHARDGRRRQPAQRRQPQLRDRQRRRTIGPAVAGVLIGPPARRLLPRQRSQLRRSRRLAHGARPHCARSQSSSGREPGQLRAGLRYVRANPELAVPLLMMAIAGCLAYEFQVTLPVMARQGLHVGASGFGFMTARWALAPSSAACSSR